MANDTYRLGTRRSTLAWAQSLWVAEQIQTLNPGIRIELVPIETRGDRITDRPLSAIEGKGFFTAELDAALLEGRVDLSVHSLKDLSLERPADIALAAIPKRENSRDIILFRSDAEQRLCAGQRLRIGTSAPRRLENLPPFLSTALPSGALCEWVEIRGNVDTRLGRLHEAADSPRALDGVVLALAGLVRLWRDLRADGGRERLTKLLRDTRWLVPPLSTCPAAPGQGALAVECRRSDDALFARLRKLHHAPSETQVHAERAVLAEFGGGCHQRFGASCISHTACGDVLYVRGKAPNGEFLERSTWLSAPPAPHGPVHAWDGSAARAASDTPAQLTPELRAALTSSSAPLFIAHSRALPTGAEALLAGRRIWTSGLASWQRLAARGVWVEGCAEALGYDWIAPTLNEPVLQLPPLSGWQILTHSGAADGWPAAQVLSTYNPPPEDEVILDASITHAFWSSGSQFTRLHQSLSREAQHACGPGKTAELIRAAGVKNLTVFPSAEEWRQWLTNITT
jgi:hydroxymethylbilane synthase